MLETVVIGLLLLALLATNIAWMLHCQRLVNKLMSRNYYEYVASRGQAQAPRAKAAVQPPKPESFDHPKENLSVLGSMIGS